MKTNKMIRITFFVIFLLVINTCIIFAYDNDAVFPSDFDKQKVINSMVEIYSEVEVPVKAEDIDLSKAIKIYVGVDIFQLESNILSDIVDIMEEDGYFYFYFYPITYGDATYAVTIQRYALLTKDVEKVMTPEEIIDYKLKEGTWDAVGVQIFDNDSPHVDYYKTAANATNNSKEVPILVGGLPYFSNVVALYPDKNGNIDKIVPIVPEIVDYERLALKPSKAAEVYNYEEIKTKVEVAKKSDENYFFIIALIIVLAIGIAVFVPYRHKKNC